MDFVFSRFPISNTNIKCYSTASRSRETSCFKKPLVEGTQRWRAVQSKLFKFLAFINLHICKNRHFYRILFQEELKKMANELSLDNVGGIFVVLLAGMGIACSIAVIEYIWKSRRLEKKINVRHSDLVKKAIVQTNTNMFYINRNSLDINGRGTIHTDHFHSQVTFLSFKMIDSF